MTVLDITCEERIRLESKTLRAMVGLYCRARHGVQEGFCGDCEEVLHYSLNRVQHCRQLPEKPACEYCSVHCYKPEMRARVREVMRATGPQMTWRHPILTLLHFFRGSSGVPSAR